MGLLIPLQSLYQLMIPSRKVKAPLSEKTKAGAFRLGLKTKEGLIYSLGFRARGYQNEDSVEDSETQ